MKAPEKIVRWIGEDHSHNYTPLEHRPPRASDVIYVRQDLTLDYQLAKPGAVEVLDVKQFERQIREELFKQVALAVLNNDVGYAIENYSSFFGVVSRFTDEVLKAAKEFGGKE